MGKSIKKLLKILRNNLRMLYYRAKYPNLRASKTTIIERNAFIEKLGKVVIEDNTILRRWVVLNAMDAKISIGKNCSINSFCHISGKGDIEIGNNVLIATQCVIISSNHNFERTDIPIKQQGNTPEKIVIEDDVWLGAGVKILAGVRVGKGCVVGAGSVVTKDLPPFSVAVGVPARIIRERQ